MAATKPVDENLRSQLTDEQVRGRRAMPGERDCQRTRAFRALWALPAPNRAPLPPILSPSQRDEFIGTFQDLDADGSGKIDVGEVKSGLEATGMTVTDKEVQAMIERFDVNGDGELDQEEWLELAAIMFLGKGERELKNETFWRFDTSKKGYIVGSDIEAYATGLGSKLPMPGDDLIAACKPETAGQLSRAEFDKLLSAFFPDATTK